MLGRLPSPVDPSRLFHVELLKPAPRATLGGPVLEEIARGVALLHRVCPNLEPEALTRFREAFDERYERREVPLAEALDDECGVGFGDAAEPSPITANGDAPASNETRRWDARQAFLLQKLCRALERGEEEIVLDGGDVEKLSEKSPLPLPDSFAVIARVAASSQAALDGGDFRVLVEGVSGPSGATLLGRFCHADERLRRHVARHLRAEAGRLSHPLLVVALSYTHMHVNRLLPSSQREHELFVYDFLTRLYASRRARLGVT